MIGHRRSNRRSKNPYPENLTITKLSFQKEAVLSERDKFNFGTVRGFGKYEFRSIGRGEVNSTSNTLFVGTKDEIPDDAEIIDRVLYPNGEAAFIFAKSRAR